MTELERIKSKYCNLSDKAYTHEGGVWAVWYDLYRELSRICDVYEYDYYALYSTALGAVQYGEFMPGDCGIIVGLLRKDYDDLLTHCDEFKFPYFLQHCTTDKEYGYSFMKLCNSNTTCDVRAFQHNNYNHGMVLDIFPLDNVMPKDYEQNSRLIYDLIMKSSAAMRLYKNKKTERDNKIIQKYYDKEMSYIDINKKIEELATKYKEIDTGYLSTVVCTFFDCKKSIFPKKIFDAHIDIGFLGETIRVPSGCNEMLNICYGNYRTIQKIDVSWNDVSFYPEIPYEIFYSKSLSE